MKRKIKKIFKLLLALFSAIILIGLGGLWRLSSRPVKFDAHSPVLRHIPDSIKFSEIFLKAGKFYTIPELELREVYFKGPNIEISSPKLLASWNLWHLLRGDLRISYVRFDSPHVHIHDENTRPENEVSSIGEALNVVFEDIPVKHLEITNGKILFDYEGSPIEINHSELYVLKLSKGKNFQFSGLLKKESLPSFEFLIKGQVDSESHNLKGEISCKKIIPAKLPLPLFANKYSQFYKEPLDVELTVSELPQNEKFSVKGRVVFDYQSPTETVVNIEGDKKGSQFILNISSPRIPVQALPKIWLPVGEEIRSWVLDSVPYGVIQNIDLRFIFEKNESNEFLLSDMRGNLQTTGTTIHYMKKALPPVDGVRGQFFFNKEKAIFNVKEGRIKDLKIQDSEVTVSQLQSPVSHLSGTINFSGSLPTLVWYMNQDFLKKNLPGKIKAQSGRVKGHVFLSLPLKKSLSSGEVNLEVESTLKDGNFSLIYGEQSFLLKDTKLSFEKNAGKLKIAGMGNIDGFQSDFLFEEYGQSTHPLKSQKKIKGSGKFSGLLAMLPPTFQAYLQSPKGGDAVLSFSSQEHHDGLTKVDLDLDLSEASVAVPFLSWNKPKGESAKLEIDIETKNNKIQQFKRGSFVSRGLKAQTKVRIDDHGKVSQIYFEPLILNGAKGTGKASLKNGIWEIVMHIPFLNFSPLLGGLKTSSVGSTKKKEGVSFNLDLKVGTLFFKKDHSYKNLNISSKIRKDELSFLRLTGEDEGNPLSISYQPQEDKMVLEVEIPRLDTLLQGLDISDQVKSKKVQIQASKPLADLGRPIKGKLFIEQLKIMNTPIFARLLSLISIEGLVNTLRGTGMVFDDNYAKFEYKDQQIALRRSRLMNGSIGITAKGYVDLKEKTLDLEGVLVPANFLNQLVGKIPLIGRFLTGGKDQGLFSVSYSAKGDLRKPEIRSNPLGVVAPNILKSLFGDITGTKKEKPTLVDKIP